MPYYKQGLLASFWRFHAGEISLSAATYRLVIVGHDETRRRHLERLAAELTKREFVVQLLVQKGQSRLKVANAEHKALNEQVLCYPADDASWCFWWPWQQPIGSVDELSAVVSKIMTVLRPVDGVS